MDVLIVDRVQQLLADIAPGDRLDFDAIDEDVRQEFVDEFYGQGFTVSSDGIVGCVEQCPECDGEGFLDGGRECRSCDGFSLVCDFGRGLRPYRD